MLDTNIVIRAAVGGYILSVNSPRQDVMEAVNQEPHIFTSLADLTTFLTTTVLIDTPVESVVEPIESQEETAVPVGS